MEPIKPAVHHPYHASPAADGPQSRHHSLGEAGLLLGLFQLFRISGKMQGIGSRVFFIELPEGAGVQHLVQAAVSIHGEVVAALGADPVIPD